MDAVVEITGGSMSQMFQSKSVPSTPEKNFVSENIKRREDVYMGSMFSLFGTLSEPRRYDARFTPDLLVSDQTTREQVREKVGKVLENGVTYYKDLRATVAFSLPIDKQLTLYERALAFTKGERENSNSYFEAVDQMAMMAVELSKSELALRTEEQYRLAGGDRKLWLGRLLLHAGQKYATTRREEDCLVEYQQDAEKHAYQIAMLATDGLRVPDRLRKKI